MLYTKYNTLLVQTIFKENIGDIDNQNPANTTVTS